MEKAGRQAFTSRPGREEHDALFLKGLLRAVERFPNSDRANVGLLAVAERADRSKQRQLAGTILALPHASPAIKAFATHLQQGTRPYKTGKPVDIRFTALDGREVDLAKMKGKVVLIDFWSTDCPPCVGEMPELKALYDTYHDQGFEIIGMNLDDRESDLRRFLKQHDLPWPQHFDGKGWADEFAVRFGIFAVPTHWLVDAEGNLFSTDRRIDIKGAVELLMKKVQ